MVWSMTAWAASPPASMARLAAARQPSVMIFIRDTVVGRAWLMRWEAASSHSSCASALLSRHSWAARAMPMAAAV